MWPHMLAAQWSRGKEVKFGPIDDGRRWSNDG